MKTNETITIYNLVKAWDGSYGTPVLLGNYKVWLENETQYAYDWVNEQRVRTKIGSGFVIMQEKINLIDCFILIDGVRYDINDPAIFNDARGNFHHTEFIYK